MAPLTAMLAAWLLLSAGSLAPARAQPASDTPLGLWLSQDHDGVFDIQRCGAVLCGRLVGIRYETSMPTDKRGQPQCNLLMLTEFHPDPDEAGHWNGLILDPETERTYHAKIWSPRPGMLNLRGYLLLPLFGETQRWSRFTGTIGPACHLR